MTWYRVEAEKEKERVREAKRAREETYIQKLCLFLAETETRSIDFCFDDLVKEHDLGISWRSVYTILHKLHKRLRLCKCRHEWLTSGAKKGKLDIKKTVRKQKSKKKEEEILLWLLCRQTS